MVEFPGSNSNGTTTVVQRLFVQHAAHLRGFIVALLPDLAQADDVFQETFLTVTAKAEVYSKRAAVPAGNGSRYRRKCWRPSPPASRR
jgi:DNA-directed RNA polymerase specialized sigma24 family protein